MQNKEKFSKDIIDRKPPIPIPVEDNGIFYQVETINYLQSGSIKRIRLDSNYKYCTGIAIYADNGFIPDEVVGIKKNGNFIFDKLPVKHLASNAATIDIVDNVNGSFFNTIFKADGDIVEFYSENYSFANGGDYHLIFRLENKKPDFKNKNYDVNFLSLSVGFNAGRFNFSYNKRIKKIAFYKLSGSAFVSDFSVRDSSRYYFKNMLFGFISKLNLSDVNKRFIKCDAPTDDLMFEFNVSGTGTVDIFIVFEYED